MPEPAAAPACFILDGKGYVGTGVRGQTSSPIPSDALWEYDPQADAWTRRATFPGAPRYRAIGFSMHGRGYLGTGIESIGQSSAVVFEDLWEYDPQANAWTRVPDFAGGARGGAVSFRMGSLVFIGTGTSAGVQPLRDVWRCEPSSSSVMPQVPAGEIAMHATPNPFTSTAMISFRLAGREDVRVEIVGPDGRLVRCLLREPFGPGSVRVAWDGRDSQGRDVGSGTYLCRVLSHGCAASARVLLVR